MSILSETNLSTLSAEEYYSVSDVSAAIKEIEKLMHAQKRGTKAYEYYYSIYQVLCTLGAILLETATYKREVNLIHTRMDILDKKFLLK